MGAADERTHVWHFSETSPGGTGSEYRAGPATRTAPAEAGKSDGGSAHPDRTTNRRTAPRFRRGDCRCPQADGRPARKTAANGEESPGAFRQRAQRRVSPAVATVRVRQTNDRWAFARVSHRR